MLDIVKDFLALRVIADFDNLYFMEYVKDREICKQIVLEDKYHGLLEIQTTTTGMRLTEQDQFVKDEATNWVNFMRNKAFGKRDLNTPQTIRIDLYSRELFFELPMYIIYNVIRKGYVSLWFYLSPFIAMSLQFILPYIKIIEEQNDLRDSFVKTVSASVWVAKLQRETGRSKNL